MQLRDVQNTWNDLGRLDPLWAILSWPDKRGNRWNLREFFALGEVEIQERLDKGAKWNLPTHCREALDFGCGVGRLTQAMARHFGHAAGVDIAPSMIRQARRYNRRGSRCSYHHNPADNLRLFADGRFDFVYCNIVLQHMPPDLAIGYVREFVRVLASGGLLMFQVPSHMTELGEANCRRAALLATVPPPKPSVFARLRGKVTRPVKRWLGIPLAEPLIPMFGTPPETMLTALGETPAKVLEVEQNTSAGPEWVSFSYWVTKG
jgi:SAM-dependent methyltransferase